MLMVKGNVMLGIASLQSLEFMDIFRVNWVSFVHFPCLGLVSFLSDCCAGFALC